MKTKLIVPITLSIFIGSYLGFLLFKQYKTTSQSVFNETTPIYFLQQGVYTKKESMEENTKNLTDYIYSLEDGQYRVFVGITTSMENANKIKKIFDNKKVELYIKERTISETSFIEKLKQYDELIRTTEDESVVMGILKQILGEYELVVKSNK